MSEKITITPEQALIMATNPIEDGGGSGLDFEFTVNEGTLTNVAVTGDLVLEIPNNVTIVGNEACMENSAITKIIFGNSVESIEDGYATFKTVGAFMNCGNIKEIILNKGLTSVGAYSFRYSNNVNPVRCKVYLPKSVKSIGNYAFDRRGYISDVYYEGTEEEFNSITIGTENMPGATIHYNSEW